MKQAEADLMVANDISTRGAGFGSDTNEVLIIDDDVLKVPLTSKKEVAGKIMDKVRECMGK